MPPLSCEGNWKSKNDAASGRRILSIPLVGYQATRGKRAAPVESKIWISLLFH